MIRFYTRRRIGLKASYVITAIVMALSILSPLSAYADTPYDPTFYSNNDILFYNQNDNTTATCSSSGGSLTQLSGSDNEQKIWNYLIAAGLNATQAAGVLGNISTESVGTFSPTVNEFGQTFPDGGYGIVQWTNITDPTTGKYLDTGRRANVVAALQKANPSLMSEYYNIDYSTQGAVVGGSGSSYTTQSQGFVSKSASSGTLMPIADNDALLLTELTFMYQEATNQPINAAGIAHSVGSIVGDTDWDALKKQTTIAAASNIWVYSYERPGGNIDATAATRAQNGQVIYNLYANSTTGSACTASGQTKQQLAKTILASGNISYYTGDPNATQSILTNIANGSNNGNDWPCGMNLYILQMLAQITKNYKVTVNASNDNSQCGGNSSAVSATSRHRGGNGSAIDFGSINGSSLSPPNKAQANTKVTAAANLLISIIAPYLVPSSHIGQGQGTRVADGSECVALSSSVLVGIPTGVSRIDDYCTHVHIDIPPSVDPNLKCMKGTSGCDPSQYAS